MRPQFAVHTVTSVNAKISCIPMRLDHRPQYILAMSEMLDQSTKQCDQCLVLSMHPAISIRHFSIPQVATQVDRVCQFMASYWLKFALQVRGQELVMVVCGSRSWPLLAGSFTAYRSSQFHHPSLSQSLCCHVFLSAYGALCLWYM